MAYTNGTEEPIKPTTYHRRATKPGAGAGRPGIGHSRADLARAAAEVEADEKLATAKAATEAKAKGKAAGSTMEVKAPNFQTIEFHIVGIAPLVVNTFSEKARETMIRNQEAGDQGKSVKKREPKDFDAAYQGAMHVSTEGWHGVNASAFRNALISACRTVGVVMTRAKLALHVIEDGYDRIDGTPLVKITKGEPTRFDSPVRNDDGSMDIRPRPRWAPGWEMVVRVRFDADMISAQAVANLMLRVGLQVGICAGRPDSKDSAGCGWGLFQFHHEQTAE